MSSHIPFAFSQPNDNNGYLLWQVTMLWQRLMTRALEPLQVTHTQFVILAALAWLSQNKKVVTQIDIAQHAKVDRMMTSKILRNLQKKGYIIRIDHAIDTRAKSISLTKGGRDILKKALSIVNKTDHEFFKTLTTEAKVFNILMQKLIN